MFSILFIVRPPEGEQKKNRNQEEIATLEVLDFTLFSAVGNYPETKIVGRRGMQFENRDEFWDFYLTNYNRDIGGLRALKTQGDEENFYVAHGIKRDDRYIFNGEIYYSNTDGMSFKANKGVFYLKQRIFQTDGAFFMQTKEGEFEGENLKYEGISQRMEAQFPKGNIWLED
ncbi:hypothetical protein [Helicobacter pametensis]|uniref:hypothetical protein n=1 Tax=Helicobacter pametensis TaxID=95149 RepID=UPI0012EB289C|nr:hypothetical protein [Helicobacter pametensis]